MNQWDESERGNEALVTTRERKRPESQKSSAGRRVSCDLPVSAGKERKRACQTPARDTLLPLGPLAQWQGIESQREAARGEARRNGYRQGRPGPGTRGGWISVKRWLREAEKVRRPEQP